VTRATRSASRRPTEGRKPRQTCGVEYGQFGTEQNQTVSVESGRVVEGRRRASRLGDVSKLNGSIKDPLRFSSVRELH